MSEFEQKARLDRLAKRGKLALALETTLAAVGLAGALYCGYETVRYRTAYPAYQELQWSIEDYRTQGLRPFYDETVVQPGVVNYNQFLAGSAGGAVVFLSGLSLLVGTMCRGADEGWFRADYYSGLADVVEADRAAAIL